MTPTYQNQFANENQTFDQFVDQFAASTSTNSQSQPNSGKCKFLIVQWMHMYMKEEYKARLLCIFPFSELPMKMESSVEAKLFICINKITNFLI